MLTETVLHLLKSPQTLLQLGGRFDNFVPVMQEVQALVDIAEFMHYWSRRGCTLELETEYQI